MNSQHIKSVNTDGRSRKRLVFASSRKRARQASADTFRTFHRGRAGLATGASAREEQVHHPRPQKKPRKAEKDGSGGGGLEKETLEPDHGSDSEQEMSTSNFTSELDIALDRNASVIFQSFHRETWHLVRSLPEILHHAATVVDLLLAYMLSPASTPEAKSPIDGGGPIASGKERGRFVVNHATTDLLHLLAVLARDLRHEIHPYLHGKILPRIFNDLLHPPAPEDNRQPVPLDVSTVEAAFRTVSYVLRYDSEALLADREGDEPPCLEPIRRYYGLILASRRELHRRLGAEAFAPLVRKLPDSARKRHLRRLLRALARNSAGASPAARRLQADAVDGISCFLFEVARGTQGRLHSKGELVVAVVMDVVCNQEELSAGWELLMAVCEAFIDRLSQFCNAKTAADVFRTIWKVSKPLRAVKDSQELVNGQGLTGALRLIRRLALRHGFGEDIVSLLRKLVDVDHFTTLSYECQLSVMDLLSISWKTIPDTTDFFGLDNDWLSNLLRACVASERDAGCEWSITRSRPVLIAFDWLSNLPIPIAMKTFGSALLSVAAGMASKDFESALTLVHVVATTRECDIKSVDDDQVFDLSNAEHCNMDAGERDVLLLSLLSAVDEANWANGPLSTVGVAAQCLAFTALIGSKKDCTSVYEKVSKSLISLLKSVKRSTHGGVSDATRQLSFSLALEALAGLTSCRSVTCDDKLLRAVMKEAMPLAVAHLLDTPHSLWTVKSVAYFLKVLQRHGMRLDLDYNLGFESLNPNLRSRNHFMRLHAQEIISSFPQRPFVVDYADLDVSSDLDEEPQHNPRLEGETNQNAKRSTCDILPILLSIESCPISLQNERQMLAQISRVGILGQEGNLPVYYAEAAANHLVGLLHLKFAATWPVIVKSLASLAKGHQEQVWAPLFESLNEYMAVIPFHPTMDDAHDEEDCDRRLIDPNLYYDRCLAWQGTNTGLKPLFQERILMCHEAGVISSHESVDDPTFVDWIWKALENTPELIARHLDDVVSIFLCFMKDQYFAGLVDDSDAREMKLFQKPGIQSRRIDGKIDRKIVHRRLVAALRCLACVKKPKLLRENDVLESIYRSLLSHPDGVVVELALTCLSRFKHGDSLPDQEILVEMLRKGKIRNALLRLNTLVEDKAIAGGRHRQILPVLARILFGRLSIKAVDRASNNSPSSVRHAVLSFLASFCVEDEDLYPFLYFCLRSYAPINYDMISLEQQTPTERTQFLLSISTASAQDFAHVRDGVHQGFLHMLEAIIAQLGHRVSRFVPVFINIVIAVSKLHEIKVYEEIKDGKEETERGIGIEESTPQVESGTLRTLCFLRLSEIFAKFSSSVDFSPFRERLWDSLNNSLSQLPASACSSCRVPSLLALMKTLSTHSHLMALFKDDDDSVVPSVVRCINERSGAAVVETALEFVENLLSCARTGRELIRPHIPLILIQFRSRLNVNSWKSRKSIPLTKHVGVSHGDRSTWRQELTVLCRISEFVKEDPSVLKDTDDNGALCNLLVSLLDSGALSQNDYAKVVTVLKTIALRLETDASINLYKQLSIFLGPGRGGPRYANKDVYHLIASVLQTLAKHSLPASAPSAEVVMKLCAVQTFKIDEWDVDTIALTLGDLANADKTWVLLCKNSFLFDPSLLHPIISICFRFLFEEDGVISRSAVKAIKTLITVAGREALSDSGVEDENANPSLWRRLLEGTIVPLIRSGLTVKLEAVRRFYILLLAEVARLSHNDRFQSMNLHSDLSPLIRDDEPDLDFFLNITHVQIHRRARALQRLRQCIITSQKQTVEGSAFSQQTISMIFIPIATHAVYESKTKMEEPLALEAIATVGALSRSLSWSKYNRLLGTTLNQFDRHIDQERYLIGLICSIIDGFHFQVTVDDGDEGSAIWRALENRIIPNLEGLLVKEKRDREGQKSRTLRPSIVVAILKLFKSFPSYYLSQRLPRLLTVVCGMLKNRDSNIRDLARTTLTKVAVSLDITFLPDIVRELTVTLTEGYQLHVRTAAIHSILLELSESLKLESKSDPLIGFDKAVPGIMDLIQQDIFGEAQESKNAEGSHVRYVKEATGSKGQHCLELVSSLVQFKPSALLYDGRSIIQVIINPLLERLKQSNVSIGIIRRIKECLTRIATGFSRNPSLQSVEALAFIHATFLPFTSKCSEKAKSLEKFSDNESEDEEMVKPILISGGGRLKEARKHATGANVVEWRPSVSGSALSINEAKKAKLSAERHKFMVEDGYNAPKLAGNNRRSTSAAYSHSSGNNMADTSAILFGLQLLHLMVKKSLVDVKENVSECDVFVPILTNFVCESTDLEIVFLALKSLCSFVGYGLPSFEKYAIPLFDRAVELLSSSGTASNQNIETTQFCFKLLSYLLDVQRQDVSDRNSDGNAVPMDDDQMDILLSFVRVFIIESDLHSSAFRLLRAMMSRRYVSSAFYDLMEILLEQSVRASQPSLREQSASGFVNFLLNYPMSKERLEQHLKQVVLNIKYEYTEGRLSAINLLSNIIAKLPQEILEHHRQLFFLPLTLQLANDTADECRAAIASSITQLLVRLSTNSQKDIFDYLIRWSKAPEETLARTSLQICGLFVECCTDFFQRSSELATLLQTIESILQDTARDWGIVYFALVALEKTFQRFVESVHDQDTLWLAASYSLSGQHPWVRRASCRLMAKYFAQGDTDRAHESSRTFFVSKYPESIQKLVMSLCSMVYLENEEYNDALVTDIVKSLTWVLQFLHRNPVFFALDDSDEEDCDGVEWLIRRLSASAKNKGTKRRETIYKCFASFGSFCGDIIKPFLELIIEPLHRSELEARNELELPHVAQKERTPDAAIVQESRLAKDVLHLLEQHFDTENSFVAAYSAVKIRFHEKKEKRKLHEKTLLITNPETSAKRKMKKHEREKQRHKRRIEERRSLRGSQAKRQNVE